MIIYNGNYYVYVHTNIINGKKYVGITCQEPNKRWKNRTGYNPRGKGKSKFYSAILKYGWNNFEYPGGLEKQHQLCTPGSSASGEKYG